MPLTPFCLIAGARLRLAATVALCCIFACLAQAQTVSLDAAPNPAKLGQPVLLTAMVSGAVDGKVTFYDGADIIGTAPVASGAASVTTRLLPAGRRKLIARYFNGGVTAGSSIVDETVSAAASNAFRTAPSITLGARPVAGKIVELNGDGKADLAVVNYTSGNVSVLLSVRTARLRRRLHIRPAPAPPAWPPET